MPTFRRRWHPLFGFKPEPAPDPVKEARERRAANAARESANQAREQERLKEEQRRQRQQRERQDTLQTARLVRQAEQDREQARRADNAAQARQRREQAQREEQAKRDVKRHWMGAGARRTLIEQDRAAKQHEREQIAEQARCQRLIHEARVAAMKARPSDPARHEPRSRNPTPRRRPAIERARNPIIAVPVDPRLTSAEQDAVSSELTHTGGIRAK